MVISSAEKNCSTKALLALFIDGKEISQEEIMEPLKGLRELNDVKDIVEEVYLLSMHQYLNSGQGKDELILAIDRMDVTVEALSCDSLQGAIFCYKWLFAKVLCGLRIQDVKKVPSFAKPEYLSYLDDLALLGSLSLFSGYFLKQPSLYKEGEEIANLLIDLVNEKGEVDVFFFFEKGAYEKDACRASVFLLLSLYSLTLEEGSLSDVLGRIDPYQGGLFQSLDVEKKLQCRLLESVRLPAEEIEKRKLSVKLPDDLVKLESGNFCFLTSSRQKVGLGSLSVNDKIIVPSFGPHVLPLGKNDLYGLNKPICHDVDSSPNHVEMWNRVRSKCEYGNHWVHSNVIATDRKIKMSSFLWSEKKEESLSLIFFLRGSEVEIEGRKYLSGGLERSSAITDQITLISSGKRVEINLKDKSDIEIIPLAGQQYFWNSDFILSIPFVHHRITSFEFVID